MVFGGIKNLIRHGKAAKDGNANEEVSQASPTRSAHSKQASQSSANAANMHDGPEHLEPGVGSSTVQPSTGHAKGTMSPPSVPAGGQGGAGGSAAAASLAAPAAGASGFQGDSAHYNVQSAQLVEEERLASEKMPVYEGISERFTLISKMGDGAFSNVYKARDRKTGQKVAIKVVRKYELNSNQRANILKEVQIMRNLKHPGIVQLLDFSESREYYFLVLELLEGGELFHQIVKLTYFSEALARHVILQVAHGIRYLHEERGVVHRDIKPENLLFESIKIIPSKSNKARPYDEEKEDEGEFMPGIGGGGIGKVKIADFGLSKVVWEESTMTPCGTVGYTAPEIVKDERYSKSVDMWALGCVLYTLLCGFPPFYDESISVLTEKVAKGYYTFLSPWWDDISASSKDLITHLLCVDSTKRFTIDEFLAHPWCNVRDPIPPLETADIQLAKMSEMPLDSPLLQSMKKQARAGMMSPGVHQLKEAFDVTYAVHRMEEEGARRRGAANQAALGGLNEEDEDGGAEATNAALRKQHGEAAARAVEQAAAARGRQQQQSAAQAQQAAATYQGRGGADRKLAEAALYDGRAGTRDRGSGRKRAFELNMGNATLLGRRNKGPQPGIHAQFMEGASAAASHGAVPGSPMRVD